ncbi:unnamed protein product [Protopolystoma xenopodis]|uniref:TRPM SLOG domain-containing protein n=1 Tax=Protopolystoma xenopodis TaxID=117903 RepID=A0A3S5ACW2_9PLAT|nr:unnamed protein product [Protopolystoma xenopodis]
MVNFSLHPFRCGCGRLFADHEPVVQLEAKITNPNINQVSIGQTSARPTLMAPLSISGLTQTAATQERWQVKKHTREMPTNAYGTVEFQGGPHPTKARYVRLHYDTRPEAVVHLLLHEWCLRVPSLVISALGGLANAPLQAKLRRVVQSGLLRAAKTTGAWVITNGLDTGKSRLLFS